jgi:hypothetical protein
MTNELILFCFYNFNATLTVIITVKVQAYISDYQYLIIYTKK